MLLQNIFTWTFYHPTILLSDIVFIYCSQLFCCYLILLISWFHHPNNQNCYFFSCEKKGNTADGGTIITQQLHSELKKKTGWYDALCGVQTQGRFITIYFFIRFVSLKAHSLHFFLIWFWFVLVPKRTKLVSGFDVSMMIVLVWWWDEHLFQITRNNVQSPTIVSSHVRHFRQRQLAIERVVVVIFTVIEQTCTVDPDFKPISFLHPLNIFVFMTKQKRKNLIRGTTSHVLFNVFSLLSF